MNGKSVDFPFVGGAKIASRFGADTLRTEIPQDLVLREGLRFAEILCGEFPGAHLTESIVLLR